MDYCLYYSHYSVKELFHEKYLKKEAIIEVKMKNYSSEDLKISTEEQKKSNYLISYSAKVTLVELKPSQDGRIYS